MMIMCMSARSDIMDDLFQKDKAYLDLEELPKYFDLRQEGIVASNSGLDEQALELMLL